MGNRTEHKVKEAYTSLLEGENAKMCHWRHSQLLPSALIAVSRVRTRHGAFNCSLLRLDIGGTIPIRGGKPMRRLLTTLLLFLALAPVVLASNPPNGPPPFPNPGGPSGPPPSPTPH
jgi:hypothetical protein